MFIQNDCRGTVVQAYLHTKFWKYAQSDKSIRKWCAHFQETGCVCIPERKVRFRTAIETITAEMLQIVWYEIDYPVNIFRITKGATYEKIK